MPNVQVTGPATIDGTREINGVTYYGWTFPVNVNGEAGFYTLWVDTNNPASEPSLIPFVIEDLMNDPGAIDGIAANDPGTDGATVDDGRDDGGSLGGDDDGGAVADGGNDSGDGDSV